LSFHIIEFYASKDIKNIVFEDDGIKISANLSQQTDGQVIECFASGDEFYNYVHDANGFTFVKDKDGYYCYAMHDRQGEVVASPFRVNAVDPATVGLQPYVKISEKAYMQRRQEREQHIQPVKRPADGELNHGRYNNLVVFIRFAGDTYHGTAFSTVDSMFNANNYDAVSLHNYFHHASCNQLDLRSYFFPIPDGETILSYEDDYPKEYYMPYDPVTNPLGYQEGENADREFSMLERAIYYVADQVSDTLDLDYNHDGNVDNVVFGIEKTAAQDDAFVVYPNPVSDMLTLQGEGILYVRLVTITGACVYESAVKHNDVKIDMTALPQELYFLSVMTKDGVSVEKVVKE